MYGGVRMGVVTEVMCHTGDGKSAFLRQCMEGGARAGGGVLGIFGEDPLDATAERQLSADTGIDTTDIGRLDISNEQLDQMQLAAEQASTWGQRVLPIFETVDVDDVFRIIDETTTIGGAPLRAVKLDYAQIFGATRNLEDEIARLGVGLHARSRDRGFSTMLASQVANDVIKLGREAWQTKRDINRIRPSIGDTEWCRRLEKLSKAVWSLVRPNRWLKEWGEDVIDDCAELHIIKQNFGMMGWIRLKWLGQNTRFMDDIRG